MPCDSGGNCDSFNAVVGAFQSRFHVHNESDVYMCSIDAFKAFDRVNILLLFRKLRKRNFVRYFQDV